MPQGKIVNNNAMLEFLILEIKNINSGLQLWFIILVIRIPTWNFGAFFRNRVVSLIIKNYHRITALVYLTDNADLLISSGASKAQS